MSLARESAAKWLKLDALCDQFEADCAKGTIPQIETYLTSVPPQEQPDVLRELLKIELHYRTKHGPAVAAVEIKSRFPDLDSKWLHEQLNPSARSSVSVRDMLARSGLPEAGQEPHEWPVLPGFEILELLGRGGMGIVYKARHADLDRLVALKMIRAGDLASRETVARFRAESRTLAQLQHPNLVQVFEVGEYQGRLYLVFEYVEGGSLDKCLNGIPQLAKPTAKLLRSLAYATQFAHTRSIIHRDLKPANILLKAKPKSGSSRDTFVMNNRRSSRSKSGSGSSISDSSPNQKSNDSQSPSTQSGIIHDFGEPKITDFGLAKHLEEDVSQTRTGTIIGSPSYMSPEQAVGNPDQVGGATDVYSLGAILYEMLTGRPPFRAPTVRETLRQLQENEPVAPRLIQPSIPRDLETICLKCLSKEPERRYESAGALADDLDRFLRDEPVIARPVTFAERVWRWCARHPMVSVLAAILFLVTVLGTPTLAWKWNEADHQRRLAEKNAERLRKERDTAKQLREEAEANQKRAEELHEATRQHLYFRRIGQAYGEWQSNLVGRATSRLEECPEDLRNWEWYHLNHLCRSEYHTLRGHDAQVGCLKYSDDGRTIISSSGILGDTRNGEAIIWDAITGQPRHVLKGHVGPVLDIAVSADYSTIVTASAGNVKIWNDQGQEQITLENQPVGAFAVALSGDGKLLASGGFLSTISLWNVETGKLIQPFNGHTSNIFGLAISPDNKILYSASYDGTVRFWSIETGRQLHPPLVAPQPLYYMVLSPDGRYLAYAYINTLVVTDLSVEPFQSVPYFCACGRINSLCFSPEGRRLALSGLDGSVLFIDLKSGRELRRMHTHDGKVEAVAVGDGGRRIATGGLDRLVKVWNAATDGTSDLINLGRLGNRGKFQRLAITRDGSRMLLPSSLNMQAYNSGMNSLLVIDPSFRGDYSTATAQWMRGHLNPISDVAVTDDGQWYASSSLDKTVRIWNASTNQPESVLEGHQTAVTCVEFSHDGRWVASGGEDGSLRLWNRGTAQQQFLLEGHTGPVNNVVFGADDQMLVSASDDGTIRTWDVKSGRPLQTIQGHEGAVTSVAFSHDGKMLASSGRDRTVRVWDGKTLSSRHVLQGHAGDVLDVAFSMNDRRLASCSADHTIKLWDPVIGDEAFTLRCQEAILTLAFHPDGKRLFATHHLNVERFSTERMSSDEEDERGLFDENLKWHLDQCTDSIFGQSFIAAQFHLDHARKLKPELKSLWNMQGDLNAEKGDWETAMRDFLGAESRTSRSIEAAVGTALSALSKGDMETYRHACQRMLEQFSEASEGWVLNEVAWTGSVVPDSGIEPGQLVATAQLAVSKAPTPERKLWFINTLAAAQFRDGKYQDCHDSLLQTTRAQDSIEDSLLMSLVHCKLNHMHDAREWLTKARKQIASQPPNVQKRLGWRTREPRRLLLKEAELLVEQISQNTD